MTSSQRRRSAIRAIVTAALVVPALSLGAAAPAVAGQTYYVPVNGMWTINGHGYGHGHGMSQYGAQGAALQGLGYAKIAKFYYPGTDWGQVKGNVRVLISADSSPDLQVRARSGLTVRDLADGARWKLPREREVDRWRLTPVDKGPTVVQYHKADGWHRWKTPDGRRSFKGDSEFDAKGPLTLLVPGGNGVTGQTYRGALRLVRPYPGATTRDTVNVLTMDQYVRGVVPYEMPTSWEQQALRAQSVAARTYAAWQRAQNPDRYYQICDTTACQVYGGVAAEVESSNTAVQATAGRILNYRGNPAFTQFSSSSGGWTSDGGQPYLPAQKDPYDDVPGSTVHSWTERVSAATLESSHPEIGRLISLRVTKRDGHGVWNGRVEQIVLVGAQGKAYLTGDDFRWDYGLKSSWFGIEATPIIERWRHLGGDKSDLGSPKSGEFAVQGGAAQTFASGRIYWSARTGAREVKGPMLSAYQRWGGPSSNLGFPETGVMAALSKGHKVRFQHGRMYTHKKTGAHVLYGPVMARWEKAGSASSTLGFPTSDVTRIEGGLRCQFRGGVIAWDRSSDTFSVRRF